MDGDELQTYSSLWFAGMHEAQLLDASPLALELRGLRIGESMAFYVRRFRR